MMLRTMPAFILLMRVIGIAILANRLLGAISSRSRDRALITVTVRMLITVEQVLKAAIRGCREPKQNAASSDEAEGWAKLLLHRTHT